MNPIHLLQYLTTKKLSQVQALMLAHIIEEPGIGNKELKFRTRLVGPVVTRVTNTLHDRGLILKVEHDVDHRCRTNTATKAGQKLWSDAVRAAEKAAGQRRAA